jgi:hypothetical protein
MKVLHFPKPEPPRPWTEKIGDYVCAAVLFFIALYFGLSAFVAWINGAFEVVSR